MGLKTQELAGLQLLRTDHAESDRPGGLRGQRVQRQDGRPSLGWNAMERHWDDFYHGL